MTILGWFLTLAMVSREQPNRRWRAPPVTRVSRIHCGAEQVRGLFKSTILEALERDTRAPNWKFVDTLRFDKSGRTKHLLSSSKVKPRPHRASAST